jgi:hypothetical protein
MYDLNEVRGFASDIRWASLFGSLRPGVFDLAAGENLFFIFFIIFLAWKGLCPSIPIADRAKATHQLLVTHSLLLFAKSSVGAFSGFPRRSPSAIMDLALDCLCSDFIWIVSVMLLPVYS